MLGATGSIGASTLEVGVVGLYAVALSVLLGEVNDIFFTSDHLVRVGVVVAAGIAAVGLTRVRERREQELEVALPQVMDAMRLQLALGAGQMGTWSWDLTTGAVHWGNQGDVVFCSGATWPFGAMDANAK